MFAFEPICDCADSMTRGRKLLGLSLDDLGRRQSRHHQQEMSHLESQHPGRPVDTQVTRTLGDHQPPASKQVDEIPQSPPPRDPVLMASFVTEDESLNLGGLEAEAEATTSPAMRRAHENNNFFFDAHDPGQTRTSPSPSFAVLRTIMEGPQRTTRTWIDHQPNAQRVSPISESQSAERPRAAPAPPLPRKRPHPETDTEDSDDGFDQDDRAIDTAARRAEKPPQAHPVDKRPRVEHSTESDAAHQLQEGLTASSQAHRPAHALFSAPRQVSTPLAEEQPPSRWRTANTASDEQPTLRLPPAGVGKNTWSEAETERLIMLMARHGTAWAEIKRQDDLCPSQDGGPMLTKRTQVNLKDKARNLKEKFLREGQPLPRSFERIRSDRERRR